MGVWTSDFLIQYQDQNYNLGKQIRTDLVRKRSHLCCLPSLNYDYSYSDETSLSTESVSLINGKPIQLWKRSFSLCVPFLVFDSVDLRLTSDFFANTIRTESWTVSPCSVCCRGNSFIYFFSPPHLRKIRTQLSSSPCLINGPLKSLAPAFTL